MWIPAKTIATTVSWVLKGLNFTNIRCNDSSKEAQNASKWKCNCKCPWPHSSHLPGPTLSHKPTTVNPFSFREMHQELCHQFMMIIRFGRKSELPITAQGSKSTPACWLAPTQGHPATLSHLADNPHALETVSWSAQQPAGGDGEKAKSIMQKRGTSCTSCQAPSKLYYQNQT
jgi:hypothetical protein